MSDTKVGNLTRDSFLRLMKMLESSGGKNTNHKTMTSGIHAGTTAMGASGLMPFTVKELANRRIIAGQNDSIDDQIVQAPVEDIPYYMDRFPEKTDEYEKQLAEKVLKQTDNDIDLAATAWRWGHNNPKGRLQKILQQNPEYKARIDKYSGGLGLQSGDIPEDFPAYVEQLKARYGED